MAVTMSPCLPRNIDLYKIDIDAFLNHKQVKTGSLAILWLKLTPALAPLFKEDQNKNMTEAAPKKRGFGSRFSIPFRSKSISESRAGSIDSPRSSLDSVEQLKLKHAERFRQASLPAKAPVPVIRQIQQDDATGGRSKSLAENRHTRTSMSHEYERDKQTGEIVDHTEILHSMVDQDAFDPMLEQARLRALHNPNISGEQVLSKLPPPLWSHIFDYLGPADVASLAFTCKAFRHLLGFEPWSILNHPDNHVHKLSFLLHMDRHLPNHLLCVVCGTYHARTQVGKESLKPANVLNPLFNCPNASNTAKRMPRMRITFGRTLPFTFLQLALRADHHSPDHGITTESLSRRYKDREGTWSHLTRYAVVKGHLLMRVVSNCFAKPSLPPAGLRNLLYSREDFVPYFSVCSHWRDGNLMQSVKCALGHIPKPPEGSGIDRVKQNVHHHFHKPGPIVTLCEDCQPMRRCPECPTEYLIQLKMMEDKSDPTVLFKQALVVTRWSDLGDGSSPWSPEWAAVNGEGEGFDSFHAMGKRAISGVFEAEFNGDLIPGQRIVSMNPNNEKLGEKGHNWY